jgi:predicted dithiol-disulfide oxidoreductase (DUF899 family)
MQHPIVSREEWIKQRQALLVEEKRFTRMRDELSEKQRALPWVKVEKAYVFDTPRGKATLSDLFSSRSQLYLKHFMMGPGQLQQCVGCSLEVDHVAGLLEHLEHNDVAYAVVARAPIDEIEAVRKRMGWRFNWVSSYGSDFNYDFNVSFKPEDMTGGRAFYNFRYISNGMDDLSGRSIFYKNEKGDIFLTYASFGRGGEEFLGIYRYFDVMPKGRNENGPHHSLCDWARPRNTYGKGGTVESNGRYHGPSC